MLYLSVFVLALIAEVRPQFPPFSRSADSNNGNGRTSSHLLSRPVFCPLEQMASSWSIRELQDAVEAMSERQRVSPYILLSQLLERLRSKHVLEENLLNSLEGAALQEILEPSRNFPPLPPTSLQHGPSETFMVPREIDSTQSDEDEETSLYFVPFSNGPRQQNVPMKPDNNHRYEIIGRVRSLPPGGGFANILPSIISAPPLRPPMGLTVHVDSGDFGSSLPDVKVSISPFMSIVEVLRQADLQYHKLLALPSDTDVITFARSSVFDCHVVSRVGGVKKNDEYVWKIKVTDREGREMYNDVCLPDEKKRLLKPGSIISLFYVRL